MLPPKPEGPGTTRFGVVIPTATVKRLDDIVESEGVPNRNQLIGSFLAFAAELFDLRKPLHRQFEEFRARERERTGAEVSDARAVALIMERYLKGHKK